VAGVSGEYAEFARQVGHSLLDLERRVAALERHLAALEPRAAGAGALAATVARLEAVEHTLERAAAALGRQGPPPDGPPVASVPDPSGARRAPWALPGPPRGCRPRGSSSCAAGGAAGAADRLTVEGPVACVIRVQGALPPGWSDYLGGLRIAVADRGEAAGGATSELRGELLDQAALLGVLTTLYDLRLPLLAVVCVPARRPGAGGAGAADRG
jgi:hypothetical protein